MPNTPSGGRELEHFTAVEGNRPNFSVNDCMSNWVDFYQVKPVSFEVKGKRLMFLCSTMRTLKNGL